MQDLRETLKTIRAAVNERHQRLTAALDELEQGYDRLDATISALAGAAVVSGQKSDSYRKAANDDDRRSIAERVNEAISTTPKTVEQISTETGIPEPKVRGVLYGASAKNRIEKRRIRKRLYFVAKEAADAFSKIDKPARPLAVPRPRGTNRRLVVEFLSSKPGATIAEIEDSTGLTKTQIKTVLYAQDSREQFACKEAGGIGHYRLANPSTNGSAH